MSLAYVIDTLEGPRDITELITAPEVKSTSPGGYASVTFDLKRRLDQSRLPSKAPVRVYDVTSGEQVGGGRVDEQGLNDDGTWRVSCLGEGLAALQDLDEPYMAIDADLNPWTREMQVGVKRKTLGGRQRGRNYRTKHGAAGIRKKVRVVTSVVSAEARQGTAPDGSSVDGLLFQIPEGTTVDPGTLLTAEFRTPYLCGMELGAYGYRVRAGTTSSNWQIRTRIGSSITNGSAIDRTDNWSTSLSSLIWRYAGPHFGRGWDVLEFQLQYSGAGGTTRNAWAHVSRLVIRTRLYGKDGTLRPGSEHTTPRVRTDEVFTDLIWRRCPTLRLGTVWQSNYSVGQLAHYGGATAKEILDELCEADGKFTYHAWGVDPDGKTPIHLEPVSSAVRYELDANRGFKAPSPSSEVYDRVVVLCENQDGLLERVVVNRNFDGKPRSQTLSLESMPPEGLVAVGNDFLDQFAAPPNAGTITVAERVRDLWTGRYVHPAAIRPGHLCRVRGVQPTRDALNPEAKQDGVVTFRIVSNTHRNGVSTLELDQSALNQGTALAALLA